MTTDLFKNCDAFVTGNPVKHSLSPHIHNYWLLKHGIDARYDKIETAADEVKLLLQRCDANGIKGFNVTLPYKTDIMTYVHALTPQAATIGAVNTVYKNDAGQWVGDNTDYIGFLNACPPDMPFKNALIVGAGGASRAILYALKTHNIPTTITNRTAETATQLAREFDCETLSFDKVDQHMGDFDFIINTTACGLNNQNPLPFTYENLRPNTTLFDAVYTPLITPFLKAGQTTRCRFISGLDMLLYQAVDGFEKWFGVKPTVDKALKDHILNILKEAS